MFSTNKYSLNYCSLVPLANSVSRLQLLSWSELIEVQSLVFCDIRERGFKLYQFLPLYFVVVSN